MKKVWIYALAIFMLVSAFSFAGAAVGSLGFNDRTLDDSLEIQLSAPVTIISGTDVELQLAITGIKATDHVGFNMKVVDANGNDVTAKISSFQAIVVDENVAASSSVTVANFPITSGQIISVPDGYSSSINMSAEIHPLADNEAGFLVAFNGTAAEDKTFNDAKLIFDIINVDKIEDDVQVRINGNLVEGSFKLVKEHPIDPEIPDLNPQTSGTNTTISVPTGAESSSVEIDGNTVLTITDTALPFPVSYEITYDGHVDTTTPTIEGPVAKVVATIDQLNTPGEGLVSGQIDVKLNITMNYIPQSTSFGTIELEVIPEIKDQIAADPAIAAKSPVTLAMITSDNPTGGLSSIDIEFRIPKAGLTLTRDTVAVYHVGTAGVGEITNFVFDATSDTANYIIKFVGTGFSSYAVAKVTSPDTPVTPSGGGSSGSSTWATTTPTPTVTPTPTTTPTGTPTEGAPTDVPTSGQPTKPAGTPAPILGILAGLAIAGIVLRRK